MAKKLNIRKYKFLFLSRLHLLGILMVFCAVVSRAQNAPLISGAMGFSSSTTGGRTGLQPIIVPVVVSPIGKDLLVESRFGFLEILQQTAGSSDYTHKFATSVQYLQLDATVTPRLTMVMG